MKLPLAPRSNANGSGVWYLARVAMRLGPGTSTMSGILDVRGNSGGSR
jgi:hypothetical protein